MNIKPVNIQVEEDFPLTTDKTGRLMLRLPMDFRERFLTEETADKPCNVQPRGTYLQIRFWSKRFIVLVSFEYPIEVEWLEGKPMERAITRPWKIDVTQWRDLLKIEEGDEGLFVQGRADLFQEKEEYND